jgi:3-methyladenine DNA glycosylase AlkC
MQEIKKATHEGITPDLNPKALKHLFNLALLRRMSDAIGQVYVSFDRKRFLAIMNQLETLEMKPRVRCLRDELRTQLPKDYSKALQILLKSARSGTLKGFDLWPYSEFIQTYGLEDLTLSLEALKDLTPLFSSEFAVRPFLKRYPVETLKFLLQCAQDENVDLRRWASEGSRPRLPWGERLQGFIEHPSSTAAILEQLKFDSALYVRKSVANHLNDIAKDHPQLVLELLARWKKLAGPKHSIHIGWIIRHSLRTLIKSGNAQALQLIGVSTDPKIQLNDFKLNQKSFQLGDRIQFRFKISSSSAKPQKLVIDYIIHFVRANQKTSAKVFKLKTVVLPAGEELVISKVHHLKKVTTRTHYPGIHFLEIQVNGGLLGRVKWCLQIEVDRDDAKNQSSTSRRRIFHV